MTSIEWTDAVWNPVVGCSRVSAGCEHCYAERVAHRGMSEQHRGLTVLGKKGPRWTGEVRFLADRLAEPLSWRKPRRVFVNSMSDLFHDGVTNEQIAAVFGVMAACPQHTFQLLTKRPERAREWCAWIAEEGESLRQAIGEAPPSGSPIPTACAMFVGRHRVPAVFFVEDAVGERGSRCAMGAPWPLPNVWLGVSVEDQRTADERIPVLLDTPAALRWVSYEPALGPVRFDPRWLEWLPLGPDEDGVSRLRPPLRWIVVGGESGPGARPFDLAWARSVIAQGRAAGVPVFCKQLGARPVESGAAAVFDCRGCVAPRMSIEDAQRHAPLYSEGRVVTPRPVNLRDRKGGDPSEWPADLRVREWPSQSMEAVR